MVVIDKIKEMLNINTEIKKIIISDGLKSHIINHRHKKVLKYLDCIPDIINSPDYIGTNPNEKGVSLEYLKILEDNILVAVKLDKKMSIFM